MLSKTKTLGILVQMMFLLVGPFLLQVTLKSIRMGVLWTTVGLASEVSREMTKGGGLKASVVVLVMHLL